MRPLVLFALACSEVDLQPVEPQPSSVRVAVEDTFVQTPVPAVDLLVVVDDTPSMAQEIDALSAEFASLVAAVDQADLRWQLGVTTTADGDRAGWLRGRPFVITPRTPAPESAFAEALPQATGSGSERGIDAALRALDLTGAGGANAGFRRPDAALHVLFVSDGDDDSPTTDGDPVVRFVNRLASESVSGVPAQVSALVGDATGCTSARGSARPAPRYRDLVARTGGVASSICADDFTPIIAAISDAAVDLPAEFPLARTPDPGSVRVDVNGARVSGGFTVATDPPRVVFDAPPAANARISVNYTVTLREAP